MTAVKWIAPKGTYSIDRVQEVTGTRTVTYTAKPGWKGFVGNLEIPFTKIVAFHGDTPVMTVTINGTHPMTRANYRECMARKIQERNGSWMGRTTESENKRADKIVNKQPNETHKEYRDRTDAHYRGMPHPSTY